MGGQPLRRSARDANATPVTVTPPFQTVTRGAPLVVVVAARVIYIISLWCVVTPLLEVFPLMDQLWLVVPARR